MQANIKQEMKALSAKLKKWNDEYYINNKPSVDDATYDKEIRRLIELEDANPEIWNEVDYIFVTQQVGTDLNEQSTFEKIKHEFPVLSLANAFNKEELLKYENDVLKQYSASADIPRFVVEPKLDGSHIVLTYDDGKLTKAVSRGNGIIGEDITVNIKYVKGIPSRIDCLDHLIVDGEILIKNNDFLKINSNLSEEEQYSNSRNLASGSLKQKDAKEIANRFLTAFLYDVNRPKKPFSTQQEVLSFLRLNGFNTDTELTKTFNDIESTWKYLELMDVKKGEIDIPLDGMVVKLNDRSYYGKIGSTSKFPKYNIAYKFPPTIKQTIVNDIEVTVGRTGKITYVAKLKPVNIDGAVISSVTLHNHNFITDLDLRIGDTIELYRSGMVIPKVNRVIKEKRLPDSKPYENAKTCPCCKRTVQQTNPELVDYFCVNDDCESKLISKITYFTARNLMNIEGMSDKTVEKLYKGGFIKDVFDLYKLAQHKDEILSGDYGIKDKTWNKLITNIENSKQLPLEHLIAGLGIKTVGVRMAKKIVQKFKTLKNLIDATVEELEAIEDVGSIASASIKEYFSKRPNFLAKIEALGLNVNGTADVAFSGNVNNSLFEKKFCITGSFDKFSREQLKTMIETQLGGTWTSGVSKNLDALICGENAGSKLTKAEELGIKIITEKDLEEIFQAEDKTTKGQTL